MAIRSPHLNPERLRAAEGIGKNAHGRVRHRPGVCAAEAGEREGEGLLRLARGACWKDDGAGS